MVSVTAPAGAAVGVVGVGDMELLPLHPQAAKANIATARIRDRIRRFYAKRMPRGMRAFRAWKREPMPCALTEAVRAYVFSMACSVRLQADLGEVRLKPDTTYDAEMKTAL